jgi:ATP-binding cassette subfamily B protein
MPHWAHAPLHLFVPNTSYIITAATFQKARLFDTPAKRDHLLQTLFDECDHWGWGLQAWAVMANHYHIVANAPTEAQTLSSLMGPIGGLVHNTSTAVVAAAGSAMAVAGLASVGTVVTFVTYARQFMRPVMEIANVYNTIQSAIAGAERVFQIMDEVPEVQDVPPPTPLDEIQGDVVFEDVCFGYEPEVPVLKHVTFHAAPGRTIALVGPTGAGKTTIVNLLTRFYDITSGAIRVDGVDIRQAPAEALRRQLGIVLQDSFLFAGSVMDNLRYGRLEASEAEVIEAARLANADQFIRRLPDGYATHLSERGSNLSQGQRQLLSIARAMLADPRILILDEATSSVDTRTEAHIQDAMLKLMRGRTSFVIAHRLSTIREADEVLVINHGEIIERGTHEELLAAGGFYQHLYMSQFRGRAVEPLAEPAPASE